MELTVRPAQGSHLSKEVIICQLGRLSSSGVEEQSLVILAEACKLLATEVPVQKESGHARLCVTISLTNSLQW